MSNLSSRLIRGCAVVVLAPALFGAQALPKHVCAGIADPNERLACYDREFPPVAGAANPVVDLEARRELAIEEFGFNKRQLIERAPEPLRAIQPDRIEGVVRTVTERSSGERLVVLESGQTWLLSEVTWRGRLNPGDKVAIREAALGTYMMITPARVALRAKRLR